MENDHKCSSQCPCSEGHAAGEISLPQHGRIIATTLREAAAIAKEKGQAVGIPPKDAERLAELLEALGKAAEGNTW